MTSETLWAFFLGIFAGFAIATFLWRTSVVIWRENLSSYRELIAAQREYIESLEQVRRKAVDKG